MPWEFGPRRGWQIKWDHPLAHKLAFCAINANDRGAYTHPPRDIVNNVTATSIAAASGVTFADDLRHRIRPCTHLTLEAWVYVPFSGLNLYNGIVGKERTFAPVAGYALLLRSDRRVAVYIYDSVGDQARIDTTSSAQVRSGAWSHIAATATAVDNVIAIRSYINGVADLTNLDTTTGTPWTAAATDNDGLLYLGGSAYANRVFPGQIGMAKIYSRALTEQEVWQSYTDPLGFLVDDRRVKYFGVVPPTFKPAWARRQSSVIGGGVI